MADKIMVVDDEGQIRELLKGFLTKEGYEVILASNGEEAIDLAQKLDPQVILLDVKMPELDGIETCKRLKLEEKTKFIPVIMVTAYEDKAVDAYLEGADDFVNKPFDMIELSIRIRSMLRIRHLTDELERATAYREEIKNSKRISAPDEFGESFFDDLDSEKKRFEEKSVAGTRAKLRPRPALDLVSKSKRNAEQAARRKTATVDSAEDLANVLSKKVEKAVTRLLANQLPSIIKQIIDEEIP